MMPAKHSLEPAVVDAINRGKKVTAIKLLRESTGMGLKEAKELVERYRPEDPVEVPSESQPMSHGNNLQFDQTVISAINSGRKVEAIKLLRESRRLSLKEAKELVDDYCAKNHVNVQASGETGFLSYLAAALVLGLVGYFIYTQLI